ncbi:MAG TPA: nucleotide exchange factor GrpE [Candidatus Paceibacterota bacterium]|nr:nucleotide exchange factor GrpE [Candidatus Paceibacterota bacterium]
MKEDEKKTQDTSSEIEKIKAERDEYLQGWQRAKADFLNAKKRMEDTMKDFRVMANEGLIEELLPVLSSFEMAWSNKAAWEKADRNWRMGVEHIYAQLKGVLTANGLKEIDPLGQKFDHNLHEAVSHEETEDEKKVGTVSKVMEKGYMLGTKLIRPAKVVVAEPKAK